MRVPYEIREIEDTGTWAFYDSNNDCLFMNPDKETVINYAEQWLPFLWQLAKQKSELRIKNSDGVIEDPRTYGEDPETIRG